MIRSYLLIMTSVQHSHLDFFLENFVPHEDGERFNQIREKIFREVECDHFGRVLLAFDTKNFYFRVQKKSKHQKKVLILFIFYSLALLFYFLHIYLIFIILIIIFFFDIYYFTFYIFKWYLLFYFLFIIALCRKVIKICRDSPENGRW